MGGIASRSSPAFSPDPGPIALGGAGQVLTMVAGVPAFAAPAAGGPVIVVTSADQVGSAPVNDAKLRFINLAAGSYFADCGLFFSITGAANPVVGFNRGGTFVTGLQSFLSAATTNTGSAAAHAIDGSTMGVPSGGAGTSTFCRLMGNFVFSTLCDVFVQWGSNSGSVNVTLKQGSWAMLWKVA